MSNDEAAIEMYVVGLVLDPNTQAPVVVLRDESGEQHLPIWIGIAEATSIASAIKELEMVRPLTHDLMYDVLGQLNCEIERVFITDLKDSTYYAELIVSVGDRAIILDSRPSDAIALALRASAPIFVAEHVLAVAGQNVTFVEGEEDETGEVDPAAVEGEAEEVPEEVEKPKGYDFTEIDRKKWDELLEDLDPDDFKYKV